MNRQQLNGDQTGRIIRPPPRRIDRVVFQASHGFDPGDPVYHDGDEWVLADADELTDPNTRATGVVESTTSGTFVLVLQGIIRFTSSILTAGSVHWLASGGGLADAKPSYQSQAILAALSETEGIVDLGEPTKTAKVWLEGVSYSDFTSQPMRIDWSCSFLSSSATYTFIGFMIINGWDTGTGNIDFAAFLTQRVNSGGVWQPTTAPTKLGSLYYNLYGGVSGPGSATLVINDGVGFTLDESIDGYIHGFATAL